MSEKFPYNQEEAHEEALEIQKNVDEKSTRKDYERAEEKAESGIHAAKYVDSITAKKEQLLTEPQKEKLREIIDYFSRDEWPIRGNFYLYAMEPIIPEDILKNVIMEGMSRYLLKEIGGYNPNGSRKEDISLMYFFDKNRYKSIKESNIESGIDKEPLFISYSDLLDYQLKRSDIELRKPELVEKDLSIEQINNIMQKVQDINKYGTAITNLNGGRREEKYGEIEQEGSEFMLRRVFGEVLEGNSRTDIKEEKRGTVFFHINGRINDDMVYPLSRDRYNEIENNIETNILGTTERWFRGISILLDISKLKEKYPIDPTKQIIEQESFSPDIRGIGIYNDYRNSGVNRTELKEIKASGNHEFDDSIVKNPKGDILATGEYGFVTNTIKAEDYKGIVFGIRSLEKINWSGFGEKDFKKMIKYYKRLEGVFERGILNLITVIHHKFCEKDNNKKLEQDEMVKIIKTIDIYLLHQLQRVINIEKDKLKDKPELLLPIYDIEGDLLWPKQMSYEEVKDFVEEREGEK